MAKKKNNYIDCIDSLMELKKLYPSYRLGQHLAGALADYGDVWSIGDKELLFAIEKYKTQLEFDIDTEDDIDKIIEGGKDLEKLFHNEEEEEDGY